MIHFLIKSTNEVRVETMSDVEGFHKELQKKANTEGYTLTNFSWAEKVVKEKGEVVDSYYQVKYTYAFNDLKDPDKPFCDVEFPIAMAADYLDEEGPVE